MRDLLALLTIMAWPVIPLFWIPVHLFPHFFRKIKLFTYLMPALTWMPAAYLIFQVRHILLAYGMDMPVYVIAAGLVLLTAGTAVHIWTAWSLSLRGILGLHEVKGKNPGVVRTGAFAYVRHPTYLAHTMMFSGVFFITGVYAVGILAFLDFIVVNLFIIPLEERELAERFNGEYIRYKETVPTFFPKFTSLREK